MYFQLVCKSLKTSAIIFFACLFLSPYSSFLFIYLCNFQDLFFFPTIFSPLNFIPLLPLLSPSPFTWMIFMLSLRSLLLNSFLIPFFPPFFLLSLLSQFSFYFTIFTLILHFIPFLPTLHHRLPAIVSFFPFFFFLSLC